jgi:DNA-binding GntR family transcriptional regulator
MWIGDLLAHGLIRSSFVPPAPIQELRDLTRTRRQLVHEVARHVLRIQKTLEDANLKLTHPRRRPRANRPDVRLWSAPRTP